MNNITFVTAFYDIGRETYGHNSRTVETYISYFKNLVKIKNKIILFTTESVAKRLENECLPENVTVIIYDFFNEVADINKKIKEVQQTETYKNKIREDLRNNIEYVVSEYSLLNCSKSHFLHKAVSERLISTNYVSWIDFGYCRNENVHYENLNISTDFNSVRTFSLTEIPKVEDLNIEEIFSTNTVFIIGGCFILPKLLVKSFHSLLKKRMEDLIDLGLIDDDQTLMLYIYKKHSSVFDNVVLPNSWFSSLDTLNG